MQVACLLRAAIAVLATTIAATSWIDASAAEASPVLGARPPFVPTADAQVLQQVPPSSDPKVQAIRALRQKLDQAPDDPRTAHALAAAYLDFGRQIGDAHYAGYAEAVLAPWLARPQPPAVTWVVYAGILQYRHQFADARQALAKALAREPHNEQAWLMLATLDQVQGDHAAARRNCGQVAAGDTTLGVGCLAALRAVDGEAEQGIAMLDLLAARAAGLPPALHAWIEGLAAEACERLGRWEVAERHYRQALALTPQDNYLLVAYADFLLDRQRPADVLPLLADHLQSDTAFLRVALARAALQSPDRASYVWAMGARFDALKQRGSEYFGREEARFALELQHDPASALELAQKNWAAQREPGDVRVFLAAALAAEDPAAAQPVLDFVRQSRLQDPAIADLAARLAQKSRG